MPAPQASMLQNLAKNNFRSKGIKLPLKWQQPSGKAGDQYGNAFKDNEKNAVNSPTCLFKDSTSNKYHVDTAKDIGGKIEKFIDGICSAICSAWGQWQGIANIMNVMINGPVGTAPPGCLMGPPLFPLIFSSAPKSTPQELKYSNAIANAVSTAWQAWQLSFQIPAIQFPHCACFPGPMAPPLPNVPLPMMAASASAESMLSGSQLKNLMVGNLGDPQAQHHADIFDAVANAFNTVFTQWKASTMINNVMSQVAPIPTFAPPFVPCGPVVAGMGMSPPGCLT